MSLECINTDFFDCVVTPLNVFDKFNLAATCTEIRVRLSDFFKAWDAELARLMASSIDKNHTSGSFRMQTYVDHDFFDFNFLAADSWITSKMSVPPIMTFNHTGEGCHAFEHGEMMNMDVRYRLDQIADPTPDNEFADKEVLYATPLLSNAHFGALQTLSQIPVKDISWEIHHDKQRSDTSYLTEDKAIYIRTHNVVSADVSTVNPRVNLELMGVSMLDRRYYNASTNEATDCCAHINMLQLRVYIAPATLTSAMRQRAALHSSSRWSCRHCTLLNTRHARVCRACKRGKRPSGIVKRHRS